MRRLVLLAVLVAAGCNGADNTAPPRPVDVTSRPDPSTSPACLDALDAADDAFSRSADGLRVVVAILDEIHGMTDAIVDFDPGALARAQERIADLEADLVSPDLAIGPAVDRYRTAKERCRALK